MRHGLNHTERGTEPRTTFQTNSEVECAEVHDLYEGSIREQQSAAGLVSFSLDKSGDYNECQRLPSTAAWDPGVPISSHELAEDPTFPPLRIGSIESSDESDPTDRAFLHSKHAEDCRIRDSSHEDHGANEHQPAALLG